MDHLTYDELTQMLTWLRAAERDARRDHNSLVYLLDKLSACLAGGLSADERSGLASRLRPTPVGSGLPDAVINVLMTRVHSGGLHYHVISRLMVEVESARTAAWRRRQDAALADKSDRRRQVTERTRAAEAEFDSIGRS